MSLVALGITKRFLQFWIFITDDFELSSSKVTFYQNMDHPEALFSWFLLGFKEVNRKEDIDKLLEC